MKFVKENLFVLICGVIAIAALALRFTWVGSVQDETRTQMTARMDKAAQAVQLSQQNINLPNNPQLNDMRTAITEDVIKAKEEIQKWINGQAEEISQQAAVANQNNRVHKDPKNHKLVPLLNGERLNGFLPTIQPGRDPHMVKPKYDRVFDHWLAQLLYNSKPQHGRNYDLEGSAPAAAEITNELARQAAAEAANAPRVFGQPVAPMVTTFSKLETDRRTAQILTGKASQIHIYANRSSFQIRGWYNSPQAPTENQIFEGVFDCWLQQDVVRAINAVNGDSRSVIQSPIKRLEKIAVGSQLATTAHGGAFTMAPGSSGVPGGAPATVTLDGGLLFLGQVVAVPPAGQAMPTLQPAQPQVAALDYMKSMTGRVGNDKWDVTLMTVIVHIDPSKLNQFISKLYQQNNSYTVLDVKLETIDPFEAASNGYVYGNVPVVRADILVEALFFRNWTAQVMPENYRAVLRIPELQPTDPAANPQAGM